MFQLKIQQQGELGNRRNLHRWFAYGNGSCEAVGGLHRGGVLCPVCEADVHDSYTLVAGSAIADELQGYRLKKLAAHFNHRPSVIVQLFQFGKQPAPGEEHR